MTIYKITMSDGKRLDLRARNAADAIQIGLLLHIGHTVTECYSGLTEEDCRFVRSTSDKKALPGLIQHDIPRHEALTESDITVRPKRVDNTSPMFDVSEVEHESKKAIARRDYDASLVTLKTPSTA